MSMWNWKFVILVISITGLALGLENGGVVLWQGVVLSLVHFATLFRALSSRMHVSTRVVLVLCPVAAAILLPPVDDGDLWINLLALPFMAQRLALSYFEQTPSGWIRRKARGVTVGAGPV